MLYNALWMHAAREKKKSSKSVFFGGGTCSGGPAGKSAGEGKTRATRWKRHTKFLRDKREVSCDSPVSVLQENVIRFYLPKACVAKGKPTQEGGNIAQYIQD